MPARIRSDMSTGERIAAWRVYRGLTQETCAGLVGKSLSWWKKVEAGVRPVEKLSDLITIAHVLRVRDLSDLTGMARLSLAVDDTGEHPLLSSVRAAFNVIPSRSGTPPDPDAIRRTVELAWDAWHTSSHFHSRVGEHVPGLVRDVERLLRTCPDEQRRDAHRLRADCYHLVRGWLRKVCAYDLARIAAERQMQSALRADDPARIGIAAFGLAGVLLPQRPDEGLDLSVNAMNVVEPHVGGQTAEQVEMLAVWGSLNLSAAVAAARSGQDRHAWRFLDRADQAASRLGPTYAHRTTMFGSANVAAYAVAVPVELGRSGSAFDAAARRFDPSAMPSVERRARTLIDVARGHAHRRDDAAAVAYFDMAARESLEELQHCLVAHSVIQEMLRRARKPVSARLRTLARQVGVLEAV